jgi:NADH pyrophosphatase NudC (nudix superfamily)
MFYQEGSDIQQRLASWHHRCSRCGNEVAALPNGAVSQCLKCTEEIFGRIEQQRPMKEMVQ